MTGWRIYAWQHRFEGIWVSIEAELPDWRSPEGTVPLRIHSALPPMRDVAHVHEWLEWRLAIIWRHEVREALQYDGEVLFDPHAPDANDPENHSGVAV